MLQNFALIWHGIKSGYGEADDSLDDAERIAYLKKIHNEHTESHHVVKQ